MSALLERALPLLACPDDGGALAFAGEALECAACPRRFPVHAGDVVELMPSAPRAVEGEGAAEAWYRGYYEGLFAAPFAWDAAAVGWGGLESLSPGHRRFVTEERDQARRLIPERVGVLADVSAGAGTFLLDLAPRAALALHLDLDVAAINGARRAARGAANLLFVRCDYLALPLRAGALDACLCLDTLVRGVAHDRALLAALARALGPAGVLLADFHNARPGAAAIDARAGLGTHSPEGFVALSAECGLAADTCEPLGCLPAALAGLPGIAPVDRALARVLPPIRYLVRARRAGAARA